MDCTLVALDNSDCSQADGGIYKSYVAECAGITAVTLDANGQITALTMSTTGLWKKWIYDGEDDTAFYNQVGVRTGNKHTYTGTMFSKFSGLSNDKRKFVEGLTPCCCLVAIHFLNNGLKVVQGIENIVALNDWRFSRKPVKATVSVLTDTNAGEDRIEVQLINESKNSAPYTTLTAAAIEAL